MNTTSILTIEQETNRAVKGHEIYINGLVEKLNNPREYEVKGKYIVEDLTTDQDIEPYFKCSCGDHVYRGVICCHIIAVQFYILDGAETK